MQGSIERASVTRGRDKVLREPSDLGGAKSGALGADSGPIEANLREVVQAWAGLSEAQREQIVAIVRSAGK